MSGFTFLLCSFGIGGAFAAFIVLMPRRDPGMNGWRIALFVIAGILLGFGATSLGPAFAVPAWAILARHLWMPALGFIWFADTDTEQRPSMRWTGVLLILVGVLAIATDFHHFTART